MILQARESPLGPRLEPSRAPISGREISPGPRSASREIFFYYENVFSLRSKKRFTCFSGMTACVTSCVTWDDKVTHVFPCVIHVSLMCHFCMCHFMCHFLSASQACQARQGQAGASSALADWRPDRDSPFSSTVEKAKLWCSQLPPPPKVVQCSLA